MKAPGGTVEFLDRSNENVSCGIIRHTLANLVYTYCMADKSCMVPVC